MLCTIETDREYTGLYKEWPRDTALIIGSFVAIKLLLHFLTSGGYGYFRDELYYLVCGSRLDWGYVDHPPLTPLLARLSGDVFGQTTFAVRFFPAVLGAVTIVIAALMARELGAKRFGIFLTCLAMLVAPHYLASQSKLATDSIEPPFWAGCAYLLLRAIREQGPKYWISIGIVAGLGFEAKHSIVFYVAALFLGLLITPQRRLLWNWYFIAGALIALSLALPNLIWEWRHHWATYELLSNISHSKKNVVLGPLTFLTQQLLILGPLTAPIWLIGFGALLMRRDWSRYRVFAIAYAVAFVIFVLLKGKNYYLAPAYPILFAAGAATMERFTESRVRWMRTAYVTLVIALSVVLLPLVLPILSPEQFIRLQAKSGIMVPKTETAQSAVMPQYFADRFGWDELAANTSRVFHSLAPPEQQVAGIFTENYGEAGAIDVLGKGLPPALSGHQNYFLWGPHGYSGKLLLLIDGSGALRDHCGSLEDRGPAITSPYAMPWERKTHIYICRDLRPSLLEIWPMLKHWL